MSCTCNPSSRASCCIRSAICCSACGSWEGDSSSTQRMIRSLIWWVIVCSSSCMIYSLLVKQNGRRPDVLNQWFSKPEVPGGRFLWPKDSEDERYILWVDSREREFRP